MYNKLMLESTVTFIASLVIDNLLILVVVSLTIVCLVFIRLHWIHKNDVRNDVMISIKSVWLSLLIDTKVDALCQRLGT